MRGAAAEATLPLPSGLSFAPRVSLPDFGLWTLDFGLFNALMEPELRNVPPPRTLLRAFVKPLTSYTAKLTDEQAAALRAWLSAHGYQFREVPYARFAGEKDKTNVVFYESGKLVVQGKGTQEFVEFVLEPEILKQARLGYEAVLNPDLLLPRLGVD